jgi:hypothetical protein
MRRQPKINAGLQQIADWHDWFVHAHTERINALNLPKDQHDREVADVGQLSDAIRERMRDDYLRTRAPRHE